MMKRIGFDSEKYLREQSAAILERAKQFDNKLYLEFGGKLTYDMHAARVLPGFDPNVKIKLLQRLQDKLDIVICIYAGDIERKKIRADFGISYDSDTLRIIDDLHSYGLNVTAVVITRYENQPTARAFMNKLRRRNIPVYTHRAIQGYPADVETIISDQGYGANDYIKTEKPIVVVTGPGPSSGKMATCLSQVYHDYKRGVAAGYAKFETFPIWNLPLDHPVNVAYEAATADIEDVNMVDPFHLSSYNTVAVNYNRDIDIFPVVRKICSRIMNPQQLYKSPTDMGVNRAGFAIIDDEAVRDAATQEIIRRYFRYRCEYAMGMTELKTVERIQVLMEKLGVDASARNVVAPALAAAKAARETPGKGNDDFFCAAALELPDGRIVTGKNSPLMHAGSSCILNAIKEMAKLPDELMLIAPEILDSVGAVKRDVLKLRRWSLDLGEMLIALSISMAYNPAAKLAVKQLAKLNNCEMHLSHLPTPGDEAGLRKLGINLTSEPVFASRDLFVD